MPQRVVVIDQGSSCLDTGFDAFHPAIEHRRLDWNSFVPDSLTWCDADLIVPVAVPITAQVRSLFGWLRSHSIKGRSTKGTRNSSE